jgi:hypothetical protein
MTEQTKLTPAEKVYKAFGSQKRIADIVKRNKSSVARWNYPSEKQGLNGRVPSAVQADLLKAAKSLNLDLTADDLISS